MSKFTIHSVAEVRSYRSATVRMFTIPASVRPLDPIDGMSERATP